MRTTAASSAGTATSPEAILLDRDEFDALALDQNERESALAALRELQNLAQTGKLPRWMSKGDWRTPEERNP